MSNWKWLIPIENGLTVINCFNPKWLQKCSTIWTLRSNQAKLVEMVGPNRTRCKIESAAQWMYFGGLFSTYLAGRLDALDDAKVGQQPRNRQGHSQLPVDLSALLYSAGVHQRLAMVVVGSWTAPGAFVGYGQLGAVVTLHLWTLCPGKRRLEWVEEVQQHPGNDHVVVTANQNANHCRCNPYPSQVGAYCAPDVNRSLTKSLANAEFQVEDWDSFEDEHDEVGYQKSSYKSGEQ